jgi:hypothetical protein
LPAEDLEKAIRELTAKLSVFNKLSSADPFPQRQSVSHRPAGRIRWISDYLGVSETLEMTATTVGVHNFAVTKITPPKTVKLTARSPAQTKQLKVHIQNRGPRTETIRDLTTLGQLVTLDIESLGSCGTPTAVLSARQSALPITLKPNKSLAVGFDVHFTCANNRTGGRGHEDFRYRVTIHPAALQSAGNRLCRLSRRPQAP